MNDNNKQIEPYVDLHKILEHLSISRPKVEKLIKEGMPMLRLGKTKRFKISEVEEWLKNRSKE